MKYYSFLLLMVLMSVTGFSQPKAWNLNPQRSKLAFLATHHKGPVVGYLDQFTAKVSAANADLSDAQIEIDANVYSFNSAHSARDQQFMAAEFFDVARYPVLTYKSTSLIRVNANTYRISGILQLHGVTEYVPMTMRLKNSISDSAKVPGPVTVQISAVVDRKHFNIGNTYSPYLISNTLQLVAEWELMIADN